MTRLGILLAATAVLAAACAPTAPLVVHTPFDPEAGAWSAARGTGSIAGQGFLRQQGGGVVTCAGAEVAAVPVTSYSTERMTLLYGRVDQGFNPVPPFGRQLAESPQGYQAQMRRTRCDAQGRFRIGELPPGEYYVITTVTWMVGNSQQGGGLMARVRLAEGGAAELLLTR